MSLPFVSMAPVFPTDASSDPVRIVSVDPNGEPDFDSGEVECAYCGPGRECDCCEPVSEAYDVECDR